MQCTDAMYMYIPMTDEHMSTSATAVSFHVVNFVKIKIIEIKIMTLLLLGVLSMTAAGLLIGGTSAAEQVTPASSVVANNPRLQWLTQAVRASLSQVEIDSCGSEEKHPCGGRDFSNAAVSTYLVSLIDSNSLGVDVNASGAMHWLRKVQPDASFVGQGFCALANEPAFMNALNDSAREWVLQSIDKALPSLSTWRGADVSYSNMYFMGMVNTFLCSSAPGLPNATRIADAREHGKELLQEWLVYASKAGNHEFDSPTYYWVQMNALGLGCMTERREATKPETICQILEHLWADVAANYFAPTETLSGPHSRDYDFLYGHGALQVLTYVNGLGRSPPVCEVKDAHCERTNDGQNALTLLNAIRARDGSSVGHRPAASTLGLSRIAPSREVRSRWLGQKRTANNESYHFGDRYNYIQTGVYAIGSASSDYITNTHLKYFPCPQDKLWSVDLQADTARDTQLRPLPSVTLVSDWSDGSGNKHDAPWGHAWKGNPTDKPSHLATHPGNVQSRNVLLATSALNPSEPLDGFAIQDGIRSLASNIIMPANCSDGVIVSQNALTHFACPVLKPFTRHLNLARGNNNTVAMRVGDSCVAVRVIEADGCNGQAPHLELKSEAKGLELGALRLALYHYKGVNSSLSQSSHVKNAFLVVADECSFGRTSLEELALKVSSARVESVVDRVAGNWIVSASVDGTELWVERDISEPHCERWSCVLERRINGSSVVPVPLSMNGRKIVPLPLPTGIG